MFEQDEQHITFITNQILFCYRVMPYRLKNVDVIYQRLENKIFKPLIGCTIDVYVDNMITKSKNLAQHIKCLKGTFELLRRYD